MKKEKQLEEVKKELSTYLYQLGFQTFNFEATKKVLADKIRTLNDKMIKLKKKTKK